VSIDLDMGMRLLLTLLIGKLLPRSKMRNRPLRGLGRLCSKTSGNIRDSDCADYIKCQNDPVPALLGVLY